MQLLGDRATHSDCATRLYMNYWANYWQLVYCNLTVQPGPTLRPTPSSLQLMWPSRAGGTPRSTDWAVGNYKSGEDNLQLSCVACLEQAQVLSGQEGNSMPQEPQAQTNETRITNTNSNRGEDPPGAQGRFKTWAVKAPWDNVPRCNQLCSCAHLYIMLVQVQ